MPCYPYCPLVFVCPPVGLCGRRSRSSLFRVQIYITPPPFSKFSRNFSIYLTVNANNFLFAFINIFSPKVFRPFCLFHRNRKDIIRHCLGKYVTVWHRNFSVCYCHLSEWRVKKGDCVRPGDAIWISGSTGSSTGPHLHLTVRMGLKHLYPGVLLQFIDDTRKQALRKLSE